MCLLCVCVRVRVCVVYDCRSRDFYHTCYCLSGLSVAQHTRSGDVGDVWGDKDNLLVRPTCASRLSPSSKGPVLTGNCACVSPIQEPVDARYNITRKRVLAARAHFMKLPCSHDLFMGAEAATTPPSAACSVGAGAGAGAGVGAGVGAGGCDSESVDGDVAMVAESN